MAENLLHNNWTSLDQHELRLLLDKRIGGPGQFDDRHANPNRFYLPLARDACKVALTFRGKEIIAIEAGPAFDQVQWQKISAEIENTILVGPQKIGREYSFCGYRVMGSWRGARSGVQILPPPPEAPSAPVEMAQHPFIIEFPITGPPDDLWQITNFRRIREHRQLTQVLNVLLAPTIVIESSRTEHFWAHIPSADGSGNGESRWLQRFFWAPLGRVVADELSPEATERIEEIESDAYYASAGYDGRPLRVPTDLDDSLCTYRDLAKENRAKFDRSTFWMNIASRQWTISASASFTSLVSAVESLTERGVKHSIYCLQCNKKQSHESPGATERFRSFFETHAPGAALRERRKQMYALRSGIVHGGELMQMEQDLDFGWDPPGWNEKKLYRELYSITKMALRNWLKNTSAAN